jgi:hypothetical protein
VAPPGAPNLTASLAFDEAFPSFGASTPGGQPYDVAVSISAEGFNQLLKAQTECGLLVTSIDEIDLGFGPLPLTAGLLSALMPEFAIYPPATPFRIDIRPTLAPIVTGNAGPACSRRSSGTPRRTRATRSGWARPAAPRTARGRRRSAP